MLQSFLTDGLELGLSFFQRLDLAPKCRDLTNGVANLSSARCLFREFPQTSIFSERFHAPPSTIFAITERSQCAKPLYQHSTNFFNTKLTQPLRSESKWSRAHTGPGNRETTKRYAQLWVRFRDYSGRLKIQSDSSNEAE